MFSLLKMWNVWSASYLDDSIAWAKKSEKVWMRLQSYVTKQKQLKMRMFLFVGVSGEWNVRWRLTWLCYDCYLYDNSIQYKQTAAADSKLKTMSYLTLCILMFSIFLMPASVMLLISFYELLAWMLFHFLVYNLYTMHSISFLIPKSISRLFHSKVH